MPHPSKWLPAVASGLLLSAAFPKIGLTGLAWIALVPLFVGLRGVPAGQAFRLGVMAGLTHYLTLLYWVVITMRTYGYLPWWQCISLLALLATYLALYPGLFAFVLTRYCRQPVHLLWLAPVFWVALEYVRSVALTGFPWGLVGYSQADRLHIVQISDMFGVYGVSFVVIMANAAVYLLLLHAAGKAWRGCRIDRRQAIATTLLTLVLIAGVLIYGKIRIGNIDQAHKWDPAYQISTTQKYLELTRSAAAHRPDLVVWPETATPFYFEGSPKLTRLVKDTVRQAGVHLLVGSPSVQGTPDRYAYYNSAYMVTPEGLSTGRYDKVHLVPFGEYVPLKHLLFFVDKMVAQVGDFSSGEKGRTLSWGPVEHPVGVQICFEIIFPGLSRSLVRNGAGVLVNLTNDAWFKRSSAAYQHFSMAVFRAIENRRSLVRCANTGISGFVDPAGRVLASSALFEDAVMIQRVPVLKQLSPYTRIGDILPMICLMVMIGSVLHDHSHTRKMAGWGRLMAVMHAIKKTVGRMAGKRR
jgi:apolipoprotein N-acyltransferase